MTPPNADLLSFLEAEQLSHVKQTVLPRRKLSKRIFFLLILLRLYVFLAIPLVAYAFIHALTFTQN
jgi:hypothetical protein